MSLRRFCLMMVACGCLVAGVAGCATETPAEHTANVYAEQELAAAPAHGNIPDYSLAKAQHLSTVHETLHFGDEAWGIVSLLLLLGFGGIAWMRDMAVKVSGNRWAQGYVFLLLFLLITTLLSLPLELYGQHLSLQYGLSVQSWSSWFGDQAKAFALTWIIGGLLLMLLFWIIRKLPRGWWFAFWCVSIPIVLLGIFAAPYIEPIFFKYQPLEKTNPALVAQLEQVVEKGHMNIPPERMFLMKASEKLTTLNADVEGFGASKRVVVWDTTISKMTPDEIVFVFGHESGHYVLGHIGSTVFFTFGILIVTMYLGYLFVRSRHLACGGVCRLKMIGLRWRFCCWRFPYSGRCWNRSRIPTAGCMSMLLTCTDRRPFTGWCPIRRRPRWVRSTFSARLRSRTRTQARFMSSGRTAIRGSAVELRSGERMTRGFPEWNQSISRSRRGGLRSFHGYYS
jgi:STE24 endopeptidase